MTTSSILHPNPPLWLFSSCLDSIQPNLQRKANCGHLTIWSRGLGIKSFPAQSEVPILLTASGKRQPGINPLPKYTMGVKDVAVIGGSRAVRIVICQGCSCERHRCREQNSLWASNWQGITWFSRARGAGGGNRGCSTSQCHPGLKDHEASWGPERPKATYSVFCQQAASLRHCFHEKVSCKTQTLRAFQTMLPLPGKSKLPFTSVSVVQRTFTKKIPRHNAPLFIIFRWNNDVSL